ncbi:FecCD family ABC transporter permease [Bacillus suaedaesalsae]|uniref:Iron ABC transporter permease n=1 Tax=Bacillus suaedaesalsae TaxID=2810349 RepID=A0ABS2DKB7_9BACI|nr:iron ABC transporter permease [Bacillus suaedaesalsae]MBM6618914.1 iron ABC transporter permease [Bacillus suaedaesalsae]
MLLKTNRARTLGLLVGIILFILSICASILLGYTATTWKMAIDAYLNFNGSNEHIIIQTTRVPRALIAAAVGSSLAIAGAIMQALTKNPLASPGIMGVNAGAGFFVVLSITFFAQASLNQLTWSAFLGAAVAAFTVYFLGSLGREGLTPMKLTLAGAAMAAFFSSFTQGLLVINEKALEEVLFWLAGSVQGRDLDILLSVLPYLVLAWIGSLLLANPINVLSMGDDVAKGLGQKTVLIKLSSAIVIVLLAGGAVAIAGPIGFIGIVIPHLARSIVGIDHRWVIPYCGLLGGILLLVADIGARYVIMPEEVPVGVMTAIIGTPFFIYIARRRMAG